MVAPDSHAERERLLVMARKLYRFASLLMVPAVAAGLCCGWAMASAWARAMAGCTSSCAGVWRAGLPPRVPPPAAPLRASANQRSERWFRVFNECSVLLFTAIVVLVVVKPF